MQIHNLKQGSTEWHQFRLEHFGASEAPVMLGMSNKITRNELLKMKHTGQTKEYSDWVENVLFTNGHKYEAKAREIVEHSLLEELFPVTCSDGIYSASCDGLTMDQSIAWEHKSWNESLAESLENNVLPEEYMPQCQQILMVTGAKELIFTVSDGTENNIIHIDVKPSKEWFERIKAGWEQFKIDLENYVPIDIKEKPEPDAIMQLPALSIQIKGEVTTSNLPAFKQAAETFISNINTDLKTDNDFANAEATVKFCAETESKIESAKSAAIAQTESIDELMRTMDHIKESIRQKRLTLEKLVKSQKEAIKNKIIDDAYELARNHVSDLAREIKIVKFNLVVDSLCMKRDFIEATKNKRTLESLHNAVDTKLAEVKIMLDAAAKNVRDKLSWLSETRRESLFPDIQQLINQDNEHFKLTLKTRIEDHEKRIAEEAKRKIEEDEKAKAESDASAKRREEEEKDLIRKPTIPKNLIEQESSERTEQNSHEILKKKTIYEATESLAKLFHKTMSPAQVIQLIADGKIDHVYISTSDKSKD